MHTRQTRRTVCLIQSRLVARGAATAVKIAPRYVESIDTSSTSQVPYTQRQPPEVNVSKWARRTSALPGSRTAPSFPNHGAAADVGKWAFPDNQLRPQWPTNSRNRGQTQPSEPESHWSQLTHRRPQQNFRTDRDKGDNQGGSRRQNMSQRNESRTRYDSKNSSNTYTRWDGEQSSQRNGSNVYQRQTAPFRPARQTNAAAPYNGQPSFREGTVGSESEVVNDEVEADALDGADDLSEHDIKEYRKKHIRDMKTKTRGSLVEKFQQGDVVIPGRAKTQIGQYTKAPSKEKKKKQQATSLIKQDVFIPSTISVANLARLLHRRLEHFQNHMVRAGMESQSYHDYVLSSDLACILAEDLGFNPVVDDEAAFDIYPPQVATDPSQLPSRPPIVTIMGHVDHGKTTLLDTLRSSSVAKGEAGGITQHIGAFSVKVPGTADTPDSLKTITFLDTPGHAAFSAMRSRGAHATDIVVLVVAADDGVMPQTKEVIELIKNENEELGVIVAINKIDKPGADPSRVHQELFQEGLELEVMGGNVPSVEVSGLTGEGLDKLVETLSAVAEIRDLRADTDGMVQGYVLESKVLKGLGPTATVLVQQGSLKVHSHIICGSTFARVKHMSDFAGNSIKVALPGSAVTVSGWKELPPAGEEVLQGTESDVKKAVHNRKRKAALRVNATDAEAINENRRVERERKEAEERAEAAGTAETVVPTKDATGPKKLSLVIKADVSGSAEALAEAVQGIGNQVAVAAVVSSGVGDVNESDVMLAKTAGGMIIAFSANIPKAIKTLADQNNVPCYSSPIIYRILDEIKSRVVDLLPTVKEHRVTGEANVLQLFDIQRSRDKTLKIAGCRVSNGVVEKNRTARVVRDGNIIHEGSIHTLRALREDVNEVRKGSECGLSFETFQAFQPGDLIQFYRVIETPGHL